MKPLTITIRSAIRCVTATFLVAAVSGTCNAAPQQLLGKSIVVHGRLTAIIEKPNGAAYPNYQNTDIVIYVSTLGRLFTRRNFVGVTTIDRRSESKQRSPDEGSENWKFKGNDLVKYGTVSGVQGVSSILFGASFQTCHVSYQYKVVGGFRDPLNGEPRRVRSVTLDSSSCTIKEGNAFAN